MVKQALVAALSDAKVGAGSYKLSDFLKDVSIEGIAEQLIDKGVIFPQLNVGDEVWFILRYSKRSDYFIYSSRVTEVGLRGFWCSVFAPARDDMTDFHSWSELGVTAFNSKKMACDELERIFKLG